MTGVTIVAGEVTMVTMADGATAGRETRVVLVGPVHLHRTALLELQELPLGLVAHLGDKTVVFC